MKNNQYCDSILQKYSIEFRLLIITVENVVFNNLLGQNLNVLLIEHNVN